MFYANYVRERMRTLPEIKEAEGNPVIIESLKRPIRKLHIFGESVQDGTPIPDEPITIASVESPVVRVMGNNLFNIDTIKNTGDTSRVCNNGDGTLSGRGYPTYTLETFEEMCPSVKVGDRIAFGFDTTSSVKDVYFNGCTPNYVQQGIYFTVTEAHLKCRPAFYCKRTDGVNSAAIISNIRVNFEGSPTYYTPYVKPQEAAFEGITLRGLKKSDGTEYNDEIVVDGKKKVVKFIQQVHYWNTLGKNTSFSTLSIDETNNKAVYYADLGRKNWYAYPKYCTHFKYTDSPSYNMINRFAHGGSGAGVYFMVAFDRFPTRDEFGKFMNENEVELICKLDVPIETDITNTKAGQALLALNTNKGLTRISLDAQSGLGDIKVKYITK